jgi:membrane protein YdbS with pleckstrin-like domain
MTSHSTTTNAPGTIVATFNPLYRPYLVVTIGLTMIFTIVGIPVAIIWFCGVGPWWARHYFDKLTCGLDGRTLRFRKGILFQVEKTIPLENIQDVTFIEGPVLKKFHLATLKFETAGHSAGQAHDMHLTGIIDAHEFRNRIIEAREALRQQQRGGSVLVPTSNVSADDPNLAVLGKISAQLEEIAALLRAGR